MRALRLLRGHHHGVAAQPGSAGSLLQVRQLRVFKSWTTKDCQAQVENKTVTNLVLHEVLKHWGRPVVVFSPSAFPCSLHPAGFAAIFLRQIARAFQLLQPLL